LPWSAWFRPARIGAGSDLNIAVPRRPDLATVMVNSNAQKYQEFLPGKIDPF